MYLAELVLAEAHGGEILFCHQTPVHPALEVPLGQRLARRVALRVLLQARHELRRRARALATVVQRERPLLRRLGLRVLAALARVE